MATRMPTRLKSEPRSCVSPCESNWLSVSTSFDHAAHEVADRAAVEVAERQALETIEEPGAQRGEDLLPDRADLADLPARRQCADSVDRRAAAA